MQDTDIVVRKNDRTERLGLGGELLTRTPDAMAWSGLKMMRYSLPAEFADRQILAPHPIVSWLCRGQTSAKLRYSLRAVHTLCGANDMMFYSGGREIAHAQWRTHDAEMLSIELDPARLTLLEAGDTRFCARSLNGTPKFDDPELRHLIATLWAEVQAGCPQGRLYTDSLSLGLAVHVHRRFGALEGTRGEDRREAGSRLTPTQLRRIDDYITQHLAESIGLTDLAREAGLSRYHFTRLFSNTVGRSPYQHVLHKRLEHAYHLLTSSNASVAQVALAAGFSSQSHFADVCRRLLGATPKELRERH